MAESPSLGRLSPYRTWSREEVVLLVLTNTLFTEECVSVAGANRCPKFDSLERIRSYGSVLIPLRKWPLELTAWPSIKDKSALLSCLELGESVPRLASLSPPNIQAAAAKAAAMEHLSTLVSLLLEVATASDELGEIIELTSLEGSFDSAESRAELALADSGDWRLYPPWRVHDFEFWGYYTNQTAAAESTTPVSFESLTWDL